MFIVRPVVANVSRETLLKKDETNENAYKIRLYLIFSPVSVAWYPDTAALSPSFPATEISC